MKLSCEVKVKHNFQKINQVIKELPQKIEESIEDILNNMQGYAIKLENGNNSEGILIEMVETSTMTVKGRVYADPNKFITRNLFNELQSKYGTDYTLEFTDDIENNARGVVDTKNRVVKLNNKFASEYAAIFSHEYLGHVINDSMSTEDRNKIYNKVKETIWYKNNHEAIEKAYSNPFTIFKLSSMSKIFIKSPHLLYHKKRITSFICFHVL